MLLRHLVMVAAGASLTLGLATAAVGCSDDDEASPGGATPAPTTTTPPPSPEASTGEKNIVQTAISAGNFTLLAAALTRANLVSALEGPGPFTVLAPTDTAFRAAGLDEAAINATDPAALAKVLQYHVIGSRAPSTAVAGLTNAETLATQGEARLRVRIAAEGSAIRVFPTKDLSATPGTDPGAEVTQADIGASNGIIHVLGAVLTPPSKDIVGTAATYGLTELAAALTANPGGQTPTLVATLQGAGPFTVFAPTNAAFDALTATPTDDQLRTVLLYHVAPGFLTSGDVVKAIGAGTAVPTAASGQSLRFVAGPKVDDSTATDANLPSTDIVTTNGIVHVVDKVLIPTL